MAKVYISSTYSDLKAYRETVYDALRQMRYDVIAMEDYVATDQRPLTKCLADVAACDLYIGIFAWRYGHIPPEENPQHKSITELEYREAIQTGKTCLIFLLAEDAPWPPTMMDTVTGEGNRGECINALRRELAQKKLVKFFKSPEGLAGVVGSSVHNWQSSQITSDSSTPPALSSTKHTQAAERIARLKAMFADHSGFMRDRLSSFVGRVEELADVRQRITALQPSGGYITITGQAGQGKSSIIAKLVEEYAPDKTAHHFIPFNPGPDHQVGLLRNVMARLILKYDLPDLYVASESRPALKEYFPKVLADIAEKGGKEEIFIDGLDQLQEDSNGERDLSFLPNDLPPGIVFVLGTRPDDALRPLKLLKPHDAYRLPNLSREDFDLILQHRGVRLEKGLADQFYRSMQENALFLDLVAQELAADEAAMPTAMIERIADNPANLFSFSMARLKRRHSQWCEVIKPVLAILLVAREPLSLRHMRQIIEVDDDWLREGIERLGGLLAQDGQQRYYLFHLKLQDYLRQNTRIPEKEYVFASDEEECWHKKLAQWCERGDILSIWRDVKHDVIEQRRREYARQHYITHLYYAREWQRLFEVLDAEHYGKAKVAYDPSMRSYAQDLDLGRRAAAWEGWTLEEGIAHLPHLWRYTLLRCSLTSRADTYTPEMFEILMLLKHEQEALGLAELLTRPEYKASIFIVIGKWLEKDHRRRQEGLQLLTRAQEIAESLEKPETILGAIGKLSIELAQAQEWERAEVVAHTLKRGKAKAEALRELGKALAQARQWDRVEAVVASIEEDWIKGEILRELGVGLAQAQEWERAEALAQSLKEAKDRDVVLRELGVALARTQQWERVRAIACSLEQIEDRAVILQELGRALTTAHQWTQAAAIWDEVLSLTHRIRDKATRIRVLQELGRTLTQVRQWGRVEVVWDEVMSLVHTIKVSKKETMVLRELGVALAQAHEWERAEAVARSLNDARDRAVVQRELGIALAQAHEWECAEAVARSLGNARDRAVVQRELGIALAQAHEWECAEAVARSLGNAGDRTAVQRELGIALAQAHEWERAEAVARSLNDARDRAAVLGELGVALAQAHEWERAEAVVRSLGNAGEGAAVLGELGVALAQAHEWERAEAVARSLRYEQDRVDVLHELVKALAQAQEWERAEVTWSVVLSSTLTIEISKSDADALRQLGIALAQAHEWERAEAVARSLNDARDRTAVQRELGIALAQAHEWERAEAVVRSLGNAGEGAAVLGELGVALAQAHEWERAEVVVRSLRYKQDRVDALHELIKALVQAREWERAEVVARSLGNAGDRAVVLRELGVALAQAHEWERAEAVARSLGNARDRAAVLGELGVALAQAHEWERAEAVVRSLANAWDRAVVLRELAKALAQTQRWERARMMIHRIEDDQQKINSLQDFVTQLAKVHQLNESEIVWAESVMVKHTAENSEMRVEFLREVASVLAEVKKYEHLLHLVQRAWWRVDTRERATELLSLATGLILFRPQIGIAFYEAFAWVDSSLGG